MTSALARKYATQVAPYVPGTLASAATGWLPFKGINDFNDSIKSTMVATDDYDSNGWNSNEKTMQTWSVTLKARRPYDASTYDPGQEIVRAARELFGDQGRVFVRFFDRNGGSEAKAGVALPDWTQSKTGVADIEEVQVVFNGDGQLLTISNPYATALAPSIQAVTPSGAAAGASVIITGSAFTGTITTTGVKFGGVNATSWSVINDGLITAVLPSGTAGSAPVIVTNGVGASASFAYTRA